MPRLVDHPVLREMPPESLANPTNDLVKGFLQKEAAMQKVLAAIWAGIGFFFLAWMKFVDETDQTAAVLLASVSFLIAAFSCLRIRRYRLSDTEILAILEDSGTAPGASEESLAQPGKG